VEHYDRPTLEQAVRRLMPGQSQFQFPSGICQTLGVLRTSMDLRTFESPEPSHIHVPRPSRVAGRQAQLPESSVDDLCSMSLGNVEAHPTVCTD